MLRNRFLGGVSPLALFAPETGGGEPAPSGGAVAPVSVQTETGPISIRDAAASFAARREKEVKAASEAQPEKTEQPRVNGKFAAAHTESTPSGEDAGPETVPGETTVADPAEQPSIEPPRSWSKEDKELFNTLPPETQQRVAERERARESDFLKRQTEATEKTKALTAKEQAADQARQQYEQAAQNALSVLQQQQASEFADIKTHADVQKLATEDPFRFAQWQARQMQITAQAQEVENLYRQREQENANTFKVWSKEQDDSFIKQFPEFADKEKVGKVREGIVSYLTAEVGLPADKLPSFYENPLFRDAMFQRVIYDGYRFHAAQKAAKAAVQKPVPQVQRPGVVQGKGEARQADVAALTQKLENASGTQAQLRAAAALRAAKRAVAH